MLIFQIKQLFQLKNGLTTSLLFFCFENAKNLGRSGNAKRRKRGWPYRAFRYKVVAMRSRFNTSLLIRDVNSSTYLA